MEAFEQSFSRFATAGPDRVSAGFVLAAANAEGKEYLHAFGSTKVDEGSPKLAEDSVFWIASCTKFITTVAALQCVEKGLFSLDEPVATLLPEWKAPEILTGFDEAGKPQLKPATTPVTLRHLLTHTSGMGYDALTPPLLKLRETQGKGPQWLLGTIKDSYYDPLIFEPGTAWCYSPGIDWAGQMVERANGGTRLGDYIQKNIFEPLGIKDATFEIKTRPDMESRLVPNSWTDETGLTTPPSTMFDWPLEPEDHCGGAGIRTTVPEYMKFLRAILKRDTKLLKPETYEMMFKSNLGEASAAAQTSVFNTPEFYSGMCQGAPQGIKWTWGLGGAINVDDVPGTRSAGTMHWNGLPNLTWFIDSTKEVCGLCATQLVPPGTPQMMQPVKEFMSFVHQELGGK